MTIGVDAGMLGVNDERLKVGVYHVAYNLLKNLAHIDKTNLYRLYSFYPLDVFGQGMKNIVLSPPVGFLKLRLPLELAAHPPDVFLGLGQALPPFFRGSSIGFIYDLGFRFNKTAYGTSFRKLSAQTEHLVKHVRTIVTISNTTKRDIVDMYGRDPESILVCYPGVDDRFKATGTIYHQKNPYVLFVGSLTKTKDLPLLIASLALVKKPMDLLLIGGDYWPDDQIDKAITKYNVKNRVKMLGFVSDAALPSYYRGATAFVTAALHEGFCLPAVEAMACGTPVIGVNRGALPEIIGDAGLVVAADSRAIARAIESIDKEKFRQKALQKSKRFSWNTFGKRIYDLYKT